MATNYICDKCGDIIGGSEIGHAFKIPADLEYYDGKVMRGSYKKVDLCELCLGHLYVFLGIKEKEE